MPERAAITPILQWANGRTEGLRDGRRWQPLVGWHVERARYQHLDTALADAGAAQITIRHQRFGGEAALVPHWDLGECIRFFPLTAGPLTSTMAASWSIYREETIAAGIGLRWSDIRGTDDRSRLAVRGYVQVQAGASGGWITLPCLVQISVRSRMTDALLGALVDHIRVCEAADTLVDRTRHPGEVLPYEVALPLGPGNEESWGREDTATVVPIQSLHPQHIDSMYLRTVWRPDEIARRAADDWPGVLAWASEFATRLTGI